MTRGQVLRWQRAVINYLSKDRPPNHTRIVAVAAAMVTHANSDGTRCRPGLRLLGEETGQHPARAGEAVAWLEEHGWATFTKRVAHGGREFTLTIPQRSGDEHADGVSILYPGSGQRSGDEHADGVSVRSASGQRFGDKHEPPTSVPPENERTSDELYATARAEVDRMIANGRDDIGNADAYAERIAEVRRRSRWRGTHRPAETEGHGETVEVFADW